MTRFLPAFLLVLILPLVASAHGIGVEAKLADGVVKVEAFYDDDTAAAQAAVLVEDETKAVVADGKTDDLGRWSFPAPKPGKYLVRVNAGDGHTAKTSITIPEPPTAAGATPRTISDGPDRATFTGPMRWVWTAVGLTIIGGFTFLARWLSRKRPAGEPLA